MKRILAAVVSLLIIVMAFAACSTEAAPVDLSPTVHVEDDATIEPTDTVDDTTAEPTEEVQVIEETPNSTPTPTEDTSSPYYIYVEKGSHTITIYTKDANGEYNDVYATYRTATGKTIGKTPVGIFELYDYESRDYWHSFGTGQAWTKYTTPFTDGIYFHAALYKYDNIGDMYHDQYYEIGTDATAGCLRTTAGCAYFIYSECPPGTIVEIVNGDPKGTTSDPEPTINPDYPHHDPTDPELPPNQN